MVEGIPLAAGKYGVGVINAMSIVFALSTIVTYVVLCVTSMAGLQRVNLGAVERYGEAEAEHSSRLSAWHFGFGPSSRAGNSGVSRGFPRRAAALTNRSLPL